MCTRTHFVRRSDNEIFQQRCKIRMQWECATEEMYLLKKKNLTAKNEQMWIEHKVNDHIKEVN